MRRTLFRSALHRVARSHCNSPAPQVDILVNNAGVAFGRTFMHLTDRQIETTYNVNILAHYWVSTRTTGAMAAWRPRRRRARSAWPCYTVALAALPAGGRVSQSRMHPITPSWHCVEKRREKVSGEKGGLCVPITAEPREDIELMSMLSFPFQTAKAFLPEMMRANRGHIVTVSSVTGLMGCYRCTDYSASKFATVGFHESLFTELKVRGTVTVKTACSRWSRGAIVPSFFHASH